MKKGQMKTNDEFLKELNELNAECEPVNKYSGANTEISFRCLRCGKTFTQTPGKLLMQLKTTTIPCPRCNTGISYPERFMQCVLDSIGVDYVFHVSKKYFPWCQNYEYDFYIPDINYIVEIHGSQHYKKSAFCNVWENMKNDQNKMDLALLNNVNYMAIDAQKSDSDYIIPNAKTLLGSVLDISSINWEQCASDAKEDLFRRVCDCYNTSDMSYSEIGQKYHLSGVTVGRYVQEGMENAHVQIEDFSVANNSLTFNAQIIDSIADAVVKRLSNKADDSAQNLEEGGKDQVKFNELLEKYGKTVEDIDFEYENLTDEELEEAFAKAFEEEDPSTSEDEVKPEDDVQTEDFADEDPEDTDPEETDPEEPVEEEVVIDDDTLPRKVTHSVTYGYGYHPLNCS